MKNGRILKRRFLWCITHLELCFDGRAQNGHENDSNWKNGSAKDDVAQEHFMILLDTLESNGFIHCPILANRITSQKITPLIGWEKIYGYWTFGARL
jgi:hypothetical protein